MRKTLTYILKSLPFLVLLLILAAVSPAHAGWWSDLKDAAVDAAGEAAAWALGIDTEDNCEQKLCQELLRQAGSCLRIGLLVDGSQVLLQHAE